MAATTTVHVSDDTRMEIRHFWVQTGQHPWQGKRIAAVSVMEGGHELVMQFNDPDLLEVFGSGLIGGAGTMRRKMQEDNPGNDRFTGEKLKLSDA